MWHSAPALSDHPKVAAQILECSGTFSGGLMNLAFSHNQAYTNIHMRKLLKLKPTLIYMGIILITI